MTVDEAKRLEPGTLLFLVGKSVPDSDGDFDVVPSKVRVMRLEPGMREAPEGEIWINAGGIFVKWPVERLHPIWKDAIDDTTRMLREHRAKLDDAIDRAWFLRSLTAPYTEDRTP